MKSRIITHPVWLGMFALIASLLAVVPVNATVGSAAPPSLVTSAFTPSAAESNTFSVRVNVKKSSAVAGYADGEITRFTVFIYCSSGYTVIVPLTFVHYGVDPVLVGSTPTAPRGAAWGTCYALTENQQEFGVTRGVVEYLGSRSESANPRTWVTYFI